MNPDIESRSDIETLMSEFYSVALHDHVIGRHFDDMDLAEHLPIIVDFWEKALFARPVYFRNPLVIHQKFHEKWAMIPEHFVRWVEIFVGTVDRLYAGEMAEKAKYQARMVADSLSQRLNQDLRFEGLNKHVRPY
ncbi:group III truncated hemoglobin [soil metagenome]